LASDYPSLAPVLGRYLLYLGSHNGERILLDATDNDKVYLLGGAAGNLLDALGPEIKKSWELYKERVTPEVANSTSHFRDALNDILAEGQKVF